MSPKKQALAVQGRLARANERRRLGRLSDLVIAHRTAVRYENALSRFFIWLRTEAEHFRGQPQTWMPVFVLASNPFGLKVSTEGLLQMPCPGFNMSFLFSPTSIEWCMATNGRLVCWDFHCLLRSCEFLFFARSDVCLSPDCRSEVVNLGLTKSGHLAGVREADA